eukprot:gi/632980963/ref/XP_007907328.1/ PREDICTED: Ig heavy chain Mem5-like [Callorhinchus milii]
MGTGTRLNVTACPALRIFPSVPVENSSSRVLVMCLASGFYPESIEMRFHSTCLAHRLTKWTLSTPTRNSDRTYNMTATACVSTETCSDGAHITCTVQHPALQSEINQTAFIPPTHKEKFLYLQACLLSKCRFKLSAATLALEIKAAAFPPTPNHLADRIWPAGRILPTPGSETAPDISGFTSASRSVYLWDVV